ncbi:helix-turn-helix domain-containing protein [Carnobacterium maltaromaticum]|uniref:helix-turn-helix domain-containing protein n=1 Tax=Carnobacterium maltaromaticum TaxID=2751 RepID=UPI0012FCC67E|nr:helix-turn-helix domain-containing protein [Carnobacterium maltaromaticum]
MSKITQLTKGQMKFITEIAVAEAIKAVEVEKKKTKKEEHDWRLRNTSLLLKNYRKLKNHCSEIYNEVDEYKDSVLDLKELTIESLEKYRFKTAKMLKYVELKINAYEKDCQNGTQEERRRYKVLSDRYLADKRLSAKEIAEANGIEQRTVYRDTKQAIEDFSIYLFGVDAIEFK